MVFNLESEFLTDAIILYAFYLSLICLVGMIACGLLIMHKHSAHRVRQRRQKYFQALLDGFLDSEGSEQDIYIDLINRQIKKYPIDCVYGGVRLVENLDAEHKKKYFRVASYLKREDAITTCLNSRQLEHQCIGLEAVGLGKVHALKEQVLSRMSHPVLAPFAIEALCRLDGDDAFEHLTEIYKAGLLTTAQALTALSKIDRDCLIFEFHKDACHPLAQYFHQALQVDS